MDATKTEKLLSEFPPHTYAAWKDAATQLLKGRPFEKTLVTPTYEGFDLQPIYMKEVLDQLPQGGDLPGEGSCVRGQAPGGFLEAGWSKSQEITGPTPKVANAVALEQIARGQDELNFQLDGPSRKGSNTDPVRPEAIGRGGISIGTRADFEELLAGIALEKVSLYFQSRQATPSVYALLVSALKKMGADLDAVRGCLSMDPAGSLAETGTATAEMEDVLDMVAALLERAETEMPGLQVIDIQGHPYHNGGASSSQELGAVLATAVYYLNAMADRGINPERVIPRMRLSLSIGGNYFIEMAKLRALRLLWSRIMDAFEVSPKARKVHVHARTGLWNKTAFDPYVNMLRTTTEAFSAVVGGCDSLQVGTFDEVIREPNAFSRRIAFNLHDILAEECDMRRVVDPAGGSWAVEALTDEMASAAWKVFQSIESNGGILTALESGSLQAEVEAVRAARLKNIQRRKDVIVGINAYPNASEQLLGPADIDYSSAARERIADMIAWKQQRENPPVFTALENVSPAKGAECMAEMIKAAGCGATLFELQKAAGLGTLLEKAPPIEPTRASMEFEQLRLAASALADSGRKPMIHQLNIGPSRGYRIRADWTTAFFQVGGMQVLSNDDYASNADAVAALKESGASVAVITSDDATYTTEVEPLAKAVKQSLPEVNLYVAGAPADNETAWREAGVDGFVHVRVNAYELNKELLLSMGATL